MSAGPLQVTQLDRAGAEHLWTVSVRGAAGHAPFFDAATGSLYYSDGWGKTIAAALRFRRLEALTGAERAQWPCGSAVLCHAPLMAAATCSSRRPCALLRSTRQLLLNGGGGITR